MDSIVRQYIPDNSNDKHCSTLSSISALERTLSHQFYQVLVVLLRLFHPTLMLSQYLSRTLSVFNLANNLFTFSEDKIKVGLA